APAPPPEPAVPPPPAVPPEPACPAETRSDGMSRRTFGRAALTSRPASRHWSLPAAHVSTARAVARPPTARAMSAPTESVQRRAARTRSKMGRRAISTAAAVARNATLAANARVATRDLPRRLSPDREARVPLRRETRELERDARGR